MAHTERIEGETVLGTDRGTGTVSINSAPGATSGLVLLSANGLEAVIWVRNDGTVRVGTRSQFASPETFGTKIGSQ